MSFFVSVFKASSLWKISDELLLWCMKFISIFILFILFQVHVEIVLFNKLKKKHTQLVKQTDLKNMFIFCIRYKVFICIACKMETKISCQNTLNSTQITFMMKLIKIHTNIIYSFYFVEFNGMKLSSKIFFIQSNDYWQWNWTFLLVFQIGFCWKKKPNELFIIGWTLNFAI